MAGDQTQPPQDGKPALAPAQFDYAWKWFGYHADQRTKMFNFMLVVFGFLAAAIANTYESTTGLAMCICAFGTLLALIFWRLDARNKQLLSWAEDILNSLEADIFKDFTIRDRISKRRVPGGILSRQDREEEEWKKLNPHCANGSGWRRGIWAGKHRYLLPGIAFLFALGFAATGLWLAIFYRPPH